MSQPITVVDLFCGAGGFGVGLRAAGLETVHAVDSLPTAVDSYRLNFARPACLQSLCWDAELPAADVIVGGPPCQGFSSAGQRRPEDARNSLVAVFAHLVARHRPCAFVFENVEGFLTGDDGRYLLEFLETLIGAGYCLHLRKVNAAHYGVPQHRKRVVAIGGLGWDPGFPAFTHGAVGVPGAAPRWPWAAALPDGIRSLAWPAGRRTEAVVEAPTIGPQLSQAERCRPGALPRPGTRPDHEGPAGRTVAPDVPPSRLPTGDGRHAFGATRRCASRPAPAAWRPTIEGDHQRRYHGVRSSRGASASHFARVREAADLSRQLPLHRHAGRKGVAHRQRPAAVAWGSAGPAHQEGDAGAQRTPDGHGGIEVVRHDNRHGDEPSVTTFDRRCRSPLLGGGAAAAVAA